MHWIRGGRRRRVDWDAWEPLPLIPIDWERRRRGDPLPRTPAWLLRDGIGRPKMETEEREALTWWEGLRFGLTRWDPRDYSKFPPGFGIRRR